MVQEECLALAQSTFDCFYCSNYIHLSALFGCHYWFFTLCILKIIHGIASLNGLVVFLSCLWLLPLISMLLMRCSHMAFLKNGNTICKQIQISVIFCPLLSLPFVNSSYLCQFHILLIIWNMSCVVYLYPLEAWGFVTHVILQLISHDLFCPLVDLILYQHDCLPHDVIDSQCLIFKQLSQARYVLGLS